MPVDSAVDPASVPALLTLSLIRRLYVPAGERTLHRWISCGAFPRPDISLGAKVRYWKKETIENWIAERAREGGAQ